MNTSTLLKGLMAGAAAFSMGLVIAQTSPGAPPADTTGTSPSGTTAPGTSSGSSTTPAASGSGSTTTPSSSGTMGAGPAMTERGTTTTPTPGGTTMGAGGDTRSAVDPAKRMRADRN